MNGSSRLLVFTEVYGHHPHEDRRLVLVQVHPVFQHEVWHRGEMPAEQVRVFYFYQDGYQGNIGKGLAEQSEERAQDDQNVVEEGGLLHVAQVNSQLGGQDFADVALFPVGAVQDGFFIAVLDRGETGDTRTHVQHAATITPAPPPHAASHRRTPPAVRSSHWKRGAPGRYRPPAQCAAGHRAASRTAADKRAAGGSA